MMRARKISGRELAKASSRNPRQVPTWLTIRRGLRPTWSLQRPSSGAETSWQSA
jgi:ribosomal protein L39E